MTPANQHSIEAVYNWLLAKERASDADFILRAVENKSVGKVPRWMQDRVKALANEYESSITAS